MARRRRMGLTVMGAEAGVGAGIRAIIGLRIRDLCVVLGDEGAAYVREVGGSHVSHVQLAKCSAGQAELSATGTEALTSTLASGMTGRLVDADTFGNPPAPDAPLLPALPARNDTALLLAAPVAFALAGRAELRPNPAPGGAEGVTDHANAAASRVGEAGMTLIAGTGKDEKD